MNEAKQLFAKGSELFLAKRYAEALDAFEGSYKLAPSPNSGLLIARCLRALGKPVEALENYTQVESEARRRVANGEAKYGITASSAAVESAEVRAGLGSLRVRVAAPGGSKVSVDGVPRALDADGVVVVWSVPGEARITLQRPDGTEQKKVATVPAGGETLIELAAPPGFIQTTPAPIAITGRPETARSTSSSGSAGGSSWAKPAALTSGAVALAGFGVFVGFGIASKNEYNDLAQSCPCSSTNPNQVAEANNGKTYQSVANAGVIIGSVAAAATVTFVIIALSSSSDAPRVSMGLGNAALTVPW